jgi:hypothetical protein
MGEAVKVGGTVKVGVTVAGSVGGRDVIVIVIVRIGLANTPVPHPDNKIDIPMIKINIFFI